MTLGRWTPWLGLQITIGAVLAPPTADAQSDLTRVCESRRALTVGTWASFQVGRPGSTDRGEVRFAIVGTERLADTSLYQIEVTHKSGKNDSLPDLFHLVVVGSQADLTSMRSLTLKSGSWRPTQLVDPALGVIARHLEREYPEFGTVTNCLTGDVVGWDTTTVPAGTFHTLHVKRGDHEAWLTDSIPFGIVRLKSAQSDLALTGHGSGAQSSIIEAPRQFPQWLSEMAMALESGEALRSRDSAQRDQLRQVICDSLLQWHFIRSDSEPYLSPEATIFLWTADSLPFVERPRLLTEGKAPKYPKEAAKHGVEGRVMLQGIVGTNGRIEAGTLAVASSSSSALEIAAQQFVERAHFAPARMCGQPVRVLIQVPIDYKLRAR